MGSYNAGPKSALFLRGAEIRPALKELALKGPFIGKRTQKSGVNFKISISSKWHEMSYLAMFLHTIALHINIKDGYPLPRFKNPAN